MERNAHQSVIFGRCWWWGLLIHQLRIADTAPPPVPLFLAAVSRPGVGHRAVGIVSYELASGIRPDLVTLGSERAWEPLQHLPTHYLTVIRKVCASDAL